jgi:hypothetical protein
MEGLSNGFLERKICRPPYFDGTVITLEALKEKRKRIYFSGKVLEGRVESHAFDVALMRLNAFYFF